MGRTASSRHVDQPNARAQSAADRAREMWVFERRLAGTAVRVAGVDEAGRGCIAGPVVAAAVVIDGPPERWCGLDDSKCLTKRARERWADRIWQEAVAVAVGMASVEEIERYNILHAARLAMGRAVAGLAEPIQLALVDGTYTPWYEDVHRPSVPVVDGDAKCLSIAAASVIAKVERDRWMARWAQRYPMYGFERNAGYGTREHLEALNKYGPCPLHRRSFNPVRGVQLRLDDAW